MTPQRHALVKRIFTELIDCPAEQRSARLAEACGDDHELRAEVERLLGHHQQGTLKLGELLSATAPTADPAAGDAAAPPPAADSWQPGTMVAGRYRIVDLLGEGGMGRVYRAEDLVLNQTVSLKFLNPAMASNREWLDRFRKEVRMARTITHTNVCRVYDISEADGVAFLSMEYVDGENLAVLLRRIGRVPGDRAVEMAAQVCAGLAAAHARGVLHRDLKPANVMIDGQGRVRLTDFGLAGFEHEIKGREILSGTPAYMAPEQISGKAVSVQSDLYSLGLVLYELFTGHRAFSSDSALGYVDQHLKSRPAAPSRLVQDIDPQVEAIILRCLEKDPANRPESALAVAAALPGQDLLAAALAADQVPSPEMVAAARLTTGWNVAPVARLCAVFILLMLVIFLRNRSPLPWETGRKHPAVLAEDARRAIDAAGLTRQNADSHQAQGFCDADDVFDLAPGVQLPPEAGPSSASMGAATELAFWYRQSPQPLLARDVYNVLLDNAQITPLDPAPLAPGMVSIALDLSGRLRLLAAVPPPAPAGVSRQAGAADPDMWSALLAAAGLDEGSLQPASPQLSCLFPADQAASWSARLDGQPVQVDALAQDNRPLFFAVHRPAGAPSAAPDTEPLSWMAQRTANFMAAGKHTRHVRANLGVLTIGAGLLILALPWAWHNYHAGLGDRRGALRLATVFLLLRLLVWLLMLRAAPAKAVIYAFVVELVLALGVATIAWLYYIALEPYARRHWPHMLITWSRVLRLRLGDPSVGQHVLIGVGLGLLWTMVVPMERLLVEIMNWPCRPIVVYDVTLQNLLGGRLAIAGGLSGIEGSLIRALLFVLLLSALRSILRVQSLAAVLTSLLLGLTLLTRAANLWTGIVFFVLIGAGFGVWMTMRYGLVMLFIAIFINRTLNTLPLSLADRFDDLSYLALAVVLGLALYGYMIGRRETSSEASRSVIGAAPPAPS